MRRTKHTKKLVEKKVELSGTKAVVALVFILLMGGYKIQSSMDVKDEHLEKALQDYYRLQMGTVFHGSSAETEYEDEEERNVFENALEQVKGFNDGVKIHSMQTSSPIMSFSNKEKVIVKVEYSFPDVFNKPGRKTDYLNFEYSFPNFWRFRHKSSSFSFYLNFL